MSNFYGYRKFSIMLAVIVACTGLLIAGRITGADFVNVINFTVTAFFAVNLGETFAAKGDK